MRPARAPLAECGEAWQPPEDGALGDDVGAAALALGATGASLGRQTLRSAQVPRAQAPAAHSDTTASTVHSGSRMPRCPPQGIRSMQ